jgi:hypothetical protein
LQNNWGYIITFIVSVNIPVILATHLGEFWSHHCWDSSNLSNFRFLQWWDSIKFSEMFFGLIKINCYKYPQCLIYFVNKSTPTALKHFSITTLSSLFQKLLIHDIRHQLASTDLLSTSSTDICLSTSVLAKKKKKYQPVLVM